MSWRLFLRNSAWVTSPRPDPDDRHVLAAAIRSRADVIVTMNLKHFPQATLSQFDIQAQHPDDFILHLLGISSPAVVNAVREQRQRLRRPPVTAEELLTTLEKQRLVRSVAALRLYAEFI